MTFAAPDLLNLLWIVPALALLAAWAGWRGRRAITSFASQALIGRMTPHLISRFSLAPVLRTAACAILALAWADPRWGVARREVPNSRGQVLIAVDVSRSMLAQDVRPSRLERAKFHAADLLDALTAERVGVIAFAGEAERIVPLTDDRDAAAQAVEELSPATVGRGGSDLDAALSAASDAFVHELPGEKVLVLLTDGEDHSAEDAAAALRGKDVRLLAVGIGNPGQGAPIPVPDGRGGTDLLRFRGKTVESRPDPESLRRLAGALGGRFVTAGAEPVDLGRIWRSEFARTGPAGETLSVDVLRRRYPWFVLAALFMLAVECALALGRPWLAVSVLRGSPGRGSWWNRPRHRPAEAVLLLAAVGSAITGIAAKSARELILAGNAALRDGRLTEAAAAYDEARALAPGSRVATFNAGVAAYVQGDFETAREHFAASATSGDRTLEAKAHYNLGNCDVARVRVGGLSKEQARERLEHAILCYRNALLLKPRWGKPRENIEFARLLMKNLDRQRGGGGGQGGSGDHSGAGEGDRNSSDRTAGSESGDGSGDVRSADGERQDQGEREKGGEQQQPGGEQQQSGETQRSDGSPSGQRDGSGRPSEAPSEDRGETETGNAPNERSAGEGQATSPAGSGSRDSSDGGAGAPSEGGGAGGDGQAAGASGGGTGSFVFDQTDTARPLSESEARKMILRILERERERARRVEALPPPSTVERDW